MNLNSTRVPTGTAGVTYIRERFADWGHAWRFAQAAGATKNLLVTDYGQEQDGAYFVDMMNYAPWAFPEGKPLPGALARRNREG